jgi:hypothetical protein
VIRRPATPSTVMRSLWEAQGKRCGCCGGHVLPLNFNHDRLGWTIEHVWPRARYRFLSEGNRFISHAACNNAKGDRNPTGCELIILALVNAVLDLELSERCLSWRDDVAAPTVMEVAFQRARAA